MVVGPGVDALGNIGENRADPRSCEPNGIGVIAQEAAEVAEVARGKDEPLGP